MQKICGEIVFNQTKEKAFEELTSPYFSAKLGTGMSNPRKEILFQNERLLRTISHFDVIGDVEMESIFIPESFTIVTTRKPPLAPFAWFVAIQTLFDHEGQTLLKWSEEFEIDEANKCREEGIVSRFEKNEISHFQKVRDFFR